MSQMHNAGCKSLNGEQWDGTPSAADPDNKWVCDECGATIEAEVCNESA